MIRYRTTLRVLVALLLLASQSFAGTTFNGSSDRARGSGIVLGPPFTMCCWGKADNTTADGVIISIGDTDLPLGEADTHRIFFTGSIAGDPIRVQSTDRGTIAGWADTTAGFTAGTWHHACMVLVTDHERYVYLDGGNKGSDTTAVTMTGLDSYQVGGNVEGPGTTGYFPGKIAECGIWQAALNDDEIAALGKGFAPPCVRRISLEEYYPGVRDSSSLKERFRTRTDLTLTGTTPAEDHPPIMNCR